jgi:hypothetical protein
MLKSVTMSREAADLCPEIVQRELSFGETVIVFDFDALTTTDESFRIESPRLKARSASVRWTAIV